MAIPTMHAPLNNIVRRQIRRTTGNTHRSPAPMTQVKFKRIASCSTLMPWTFCYRCRLIERTAETKLSSVGGGLA
jgi:hypothetical protein